MAENEIRQPIHSYGEVMKAIDKLTEEEKEAILEMTKINEITYLMDDKDTVIDYCSMLTAHINKCLAVANGLVKIFDLVNASTDTVNDIICDYGSLNEDEKKALALKMLNNGTFQKDCCEILVRDVERLVRENPTLKAINDTFNIIGWYKKNLHRGIGMNHKYEV